MQQFRVYICNRFVFVYITVLSIFFTKQDCCVEAGTSISVTSNPRLFAAAERLKIIVRSSAAQHVCPAIAV
jgi:hypothetical protein